MGEGHMAYVTPPDIEQVYEQMLAHYRELERLCKSETTRPVKSVTELDALPARNRSSMTLSRNSLPALPTPRTRSNSVNEPEKTASPREVTPPSINYANPVRHPKGTIPKLRRSLSGSLSSLVELFDK